ncbi:histidine phosphatase family protein [Tistrella mobilis]|uniref:Phosphohistidine phosphatase n=1 Tax=Tistrella mobilis TaxID=171437 RepID=A0A162JXU2_9PROT|nr:histidine phosphatase family protein [Tistrella mobilis]KYO50078.1 hypothetical protein AUP44_14595 [Tistrella mobilis]
MPRLILLRHAKSAWDDPALADHDRPLNRRGRAAARLMAKPVAEAAPDLVLCSTARRTRETVEHMVNAGAFPAGRVVHDAALYHAAPAAILAVVGTHAAGHAAVMVVGHNPGLHELAASMATAGDDQARAALAAKFPTAALAVLDLAGPGWRPGDARLTRFVTPRMLEAAAGQ